MMRERFSFSAMAVFSGVIGTYTTAIALGVLVE